MKVILHNANTDLYFIGPNMWTNDRSKAFDFERMEHAVELVRRNGLNGLELVVSFPNIPDVHVPVALAMQS